MDSAGFFVAGRIPASGQSIKLCEELKVNLLEADSEIGRFI